MTMTAWVQRLSVATVGTVLLTMGTANLSHAQTATNTFDPAAPGNPVPNSGGLTFSGFVSATGGAGGAVAAANGVSTISPVPPFTLFNFFGVSLSKPTGSSINFIQVQAFLNGSSLYTRTINVSAGASSFQPTALGLPVTVSSLTFTGFSSSPSVASVASFAAPSGLLASFSLTGDEEYYSDGYGYDDYEHGGEGYGGDDHGRGHKHGRGKGKKNIIRCGYKSCEDVFFIDDLQAAAVPEPTTMLGLLAASGGLAALKRRRGKVEQQADNVEG